MTQKRQRIRSIIILIALIVIALIAYFMMRSEDSGSYAVITVDGAVYRTLPLDVDDQITVEAHKGYNVICVEDGQAYVKEADCSNQVCVSTGKISANGEVIACLPHGLAVTVEASHEEVDAIAY